MGWETVGFCEIDEWCQKVLAKNFPGVPIHGDVTTYDGQDCDLITAGFPCQPYSLAGQRRGAGDDRALGHEAVRLIEQCQPEYAVLENVYGFVSMGLDNLLSDLEGIGYRVGTFVIPACAVDAPHRRDRVWIVGTNTGSKGLHQRELQRGISGQAKRKKEQEAVELGSKASSAKILADTECRRQQGQGEPIDARNTETSGEAQAVELVNGGVGAKWSPEPSVGRVATGVPRRVDRLRGLGNAIVPQVAYEIFRAIEEGC